MQKIKRRTLGRTGLEVSEIGLGTWPFAVPGAGLNYGGMPEPEALAVLETYVENGGNLIDTARRYNGVETILGKYLERAGCRDRLILSTKTPSGESAETLSGIHADLETSLRELKTDHVDILFLHQPPEDPALIEQALERMVALKETGKIRAIGASIKGPNITAATGALCETYIATGQLDVLQVVYSILRQQNRPTIEKAGQHDVGVIVRTTLESGLLTGAYAPGHIFTETDHRTRYNRQKLDFALRTAEELRAFAVRPPCTSLAQVATRFSLAAPGVSCIIMGAQRPDEIRTNLSTLALPPLPPELLDELHTRYGGITEQANFD